MTLSKQEESALLQVYDSYWHSYATGDIPTLASFLAEDYTQIGSVETEVFDNKKDAVHFIEATISQVAGKVDMRNRVKKIERVDPFMLITEHSNLYVLTEGEWVFYAKFRASSFLQKKNGQWKFIHQHSSMPDIRADEGENIATEKISRENIELRDAIRRRTIELEQKNQELAMEASLERVRTVAMGMRKPDDLPGICEVLFNELQSMGFTELRNAMINIHNDENSTFINYDFSEEIGPSINHLNYTIHPVIEKQIKQIRSTHEAFSETVFSGRDLTDWKAFRKRIGEKDDPRIDNVAALYYYFYSIGTGAIGISTFGPISAKKLEQLKRFRNVFEFAYRRYMDVAQAETQVRESRIEIALERVRSRTMAMFESEELSDVAEVLFAQISQLGVMPDRISICVIDETNRTYHVWATDQAGTQLKVKLAAKLDEKTTIRHLFADWKAGKKFSLIELQGDDLKNWIEYLRLELGMPISTDHLQGRRFHNVAHFSHGWLNLSSSEPLAGEVHDLLQRFASVFSLTYTRFLDLQKAEAQAKESQIEAALERVRSRSMAMHSSQELKEVALELRKQMGLLGQKDLEVCAIHLYDDDDSFESWSAMKTPSSESEILQTQARFPKQGIKIVDELMKHYSNGSRDYVLVNEGEKIVEWLNVIKERAPGLHAPIMQSIGNMQIKNPKANWSVADFSGGALVMVTYGEPDVQSRNLLRRSANVFEQAYIRFKDLKQAEQQAREAQIEAALERVRSRTMGMQKSEELKEVIQVVNEQFVHLHINVQHAGFLMDYKESEDMHIWLADPHKVPSELTIPYFDSPHWNSFREAKEKGLDFFANQLDYEEKNRFYNDLLKLFPVPDDAREYYLTCPGLAISTVLLDNIGLYIENFSGIPYSDEENAILMRFGKVFEQAYIRFNDLKQAEIQAREAQVELALERVRARTMAMQKSTELGDVATVLFNELRSLGGVRLWTTGIGLCKKDEPIDEFWMCTEAGIQPPFYIPHTEDPTHENMFEAWKNGEAYYTEQKEGAELQAHYDYLMSLPAVRPIFENMAAAGFPVPAWQKWHAAYFSKGYLLIITTESYGEEYLFKRFAQVFEQTYTRFLDLQKAEAQAREALIEVSLERVRSRSMAMHKSDELLDAGEIIFIEMQKLGIESLTAGLVIIDKEGKNGLNYAPNPLTKKLMPLPIIIPHNETTHLQQVVENWQKGNPFFIVELDEDETIKHQTFIAERSTNFPLNAAELIAISPAKLFLHNFYFKEGYILIVGGIKLSVEQTDIMLRFAKVFQQTYTRFLDLQKAEAQALEAIKRASVDRVRAEIASMRTTTDLDRITPLIWKELTILGIPFVRCGVFIMDEEEELIHTFLSTPDGKAIAAIHLPYQSSPLADSLTFWREKKIYLTHWNTDQYAEFADAFIGVADLEKRSQFLSTVPREGIYLHLLPFLQGMLYVGNITKLEKSNLNLIQSVADAFSTAYARYEDFNRLEAAKEQVDKALTDLKQAQSQLVQAEKMASLGELTAGIAHEIQNPLNFVNNFSEINMELSDEIVDAAKKGDLEEIIQLAADIKSNQDKISEHGKRADAIVKGMLQHSRSSSGVKEPTDINKLADEYFRLAYHGLRAKDKTFNAALHADYDTTIGNIPIMPQDIGRVLLNLYNNAFYAVAEKKQQFPTGYEPEVSVSSKRMGDKIEISVKDNGNGIPQKVLDKIFQPFFTTKPTGQGTGLGLSLSYDIVKAHGGELRVETKEGEGSKFIMQLPIV